MRSKEQTRYSLSDIQKFVSEFYRAMKWINEYKDGKHRWDGEKEVESKDFNFEFESRSYPKITIRSINHI